ncbi:Selenocysteine Se-methyltransferase (BoSMT), partial [Durusdinium trenchii]
MSRPASDFRDRLRSGSPVILDGATGTELSRRGVDLSGSSWTALAIEEHPETLRAIHADYVEAGAEVLTANTFRTHARNLKTTPYADQADSLTRRAVELARSAASAHVFVAGSLAPLADCYSPQLTPETSALEDEHAEMADRLAASGVDLILVETQVTVSEGMIACAAAMRTGLPTLVSFVCGGDGRLFSGESVLDAWQAVAPLQPDGFLLNCLPAEAVLPALEPLLSEISPIVPGAYANTGTMDADGTWTPTAASEPATYAGLDVQMTDQDRASHPNVQGGRMLEHQHFPCTVSRSTVEASPPQPNIDAPPATNVCRRQHSLRRVGMLILAAVALVAFWAPSVLADDAVIGAGGPQISESGAFVIGSDSASGSLISAPQKEDPGVGGYGFFGRVGHEAGPTVGRTESVSFLDVVPYLFHDETMLFGDLRLVISNDGQMGGSTGIGLRHFFENYNAVAGTAFYYDHDETRGKTFEQFGISAVGSDRIHEHFRPWFKSDVEDLL